MLESSWEQNEISIEFAMENSYWNGPPTHRLRLGNQDIIIYCWRIRCLKIFRSIGNRNQDLQPFWNLYDWANERRYSFQLTQISFIRIEKWGDMYFDFDTEGLSWKTFLINWCGLYHAVSVSNKICIYRIFIELRYHITAHIGSRWSLSLWWKLQQNNGR